MFAIRNFCQFRKCQNLALTANRPLIHTCFTYPKLNMDDFSVQAGPLGHGYSTKKFSWNSLHAEKGIGKGKGFGIIHICYKYSKNCLS